VTARLIGDQVAIQEYTLEDNPKKTKSRGVNSGLNIGPLTWKTDNQKKFFNSYSDYQVISLSGYAGTGKTYIAIGRALADIEKGLYSELVVIRSAVPGRDIGFMPGTKAEKMAEYEAPYSIICNKLYNRGDAYGILKQKGVIKFDSTSFLRGVTFDNAIIVVDEMQNMSYQEIYTILTRIGDNTKVILCGDTRQDDLTSERYKESSGFDRITAKLAMVGSCISIEFGIDDIVRSGFVKEFILATSI
jgi:predicted ribonuclease YlaK